MVVDGNVDGTDRGRIHRSRNRSNTIRNASIVLLNGIAEFTCRIRWIWIHNISRNPTFSSTSFFHCINPLLFFMDVGIFYRSPSDGSQLSTENNSLLCFAPFPSYILVGIQRVGVTVADTHGYGRIRFASLY